jgi:prolyl-tRNA synthetase
MMVAFGSTGTIGGKRSDEFHLLSEVGEDNLVHCQSCSAVFNGELFEEEESISRAATTGSGHSIPTSSNNLNSCIKCGSSDLSNSKSIEVIYL